MKIGFIGLGKMGKAMVLNALEQGVEVVAWNRSPEPVEEVAGAGAIPAETIKDLVSKLEPPRMILLMLPAGEVTDEFINELRPHLSADDLIVDCANSFYKDTIRRSQDLKSSRIHFMDCGTSGGPGGARTGACLMIGGSDEDYLRFEPLAKLLAADQAFKHLGPVGAGHFAKMVHNGIEYGMMEALAEGVAVLKNSSFGFDLAKVMDIYNHQSVITSRLVEWMQNSFQDDPNLDNISSKIGSGGGGEQRILGEADWTVEAAKELEIDTPVIEDAIRIRESSGNDREDSPNGFRNKAVSALRGQFGHHSVKK
ncbi:6-phosphogluconate dehydrogenase (decarboxylating) [Candidatus Daviesbacteria bacterium RIFCSPHIGHO2_01_FULL_44_29]|uniref:6-phosphogluconate dehydrogenase (Decarboxylating) n=1 Tax=Candidatus Daviesbacteria bacterium RIFCSPHIGHO2_02_FULL_43_12 TaxID=1797776 RepID=A0A1F5KKK7_9BACT|nr:MAG: 6-phosphogluconate dehydrogenase (decarboxylating) [Candidatus Daviesbacteria bacterium RIFCSPHIGHO2_01_FULL_44_29]OGE39572.1 MAG: 6-phosphogluconate dehydrogenase (decarboxylating) [Candidatus Daviesbacteria bacterium RIFCSPHIGHO2_12_FULL_47_45]OGE41151.1 MAG: 6-phosphogluconate dehydrogenase (decarboxylating) [Candidatus Daviesbacteria bacterium RIFCSPHIGHO2_02_FULL_43_12]OGE69350.1 MAG: 6-phosphogluconate dehydrogenase (decarboxylating) [Candidatus Daviesbacteria bacterium RIFCSPLOWO2